MPTTKRINWVTGLLSALCLTGSLADEELPKATLFNTEVRQIHSEFVDHDYSIYVFLPTDYHKTDKQYGTIVYLDAYLTFGGFTDLIRGLQDTNKIEDFIVAGISYDAYWGMPGNMRKRDFIPDGSTAPYPEAGGADKFLAFITKELLPMIDHHYRTNPSRRGFNGASLGGLFGAYVLFTKPETFQFYNISSPALGYYDKIFELEESYSKSHDKLSARVVFSYGTDELDDRFCEPVRKLDKILKTRNYQEFEYTVLIGEGEMHETSSITVLSKAVRFLYRAGTD